MSVNPAGSGSWRKRALSFMALVALIVPVWAHADGVYIAGPGASVEQVLSQALAENGGPKGTFWIVISGDQVLRIAKKSASPEIRTKLNTALERGGEAYACRTDLNRAGIREEDLLDGVVAMYGYSARDWAGLLPPRKDGIALPKDMKQSQRILQACAGSPKSGS